MSYNNNTQDIHKNGGMMIKRESNFSSISIKDIFNLKSGDWDDRGLRKETLERFGVKLQYRPEEGSMGNPIAVYFPYRNNDGSRVVGYKKKNLLKDKHESGHFTVIGRVDLQCQMFGEKESRKSAKKLIINEGEIDQLSTYQALTDSVKGTQFEKYTPAVVSIHSGTPNALQSVANREGFVKQYKEVVIAFDNDERGPLDKPNVVRGREATEAVGCYLTDQKVYTVPWPEYINDANDLLVKGKSKKLANLISFDTVPFKADKVVGVEDIDFEELIKPKPVGIKIQSFPKLMDKLGGIRKSELTILTSHTNVGKSFIVSEIAFNLACSNDTKIGMIYLEETESETLQRMIARKLEVSYYKFVFDPLKYATKEEIKEAYDWCREKFYFLSVFGSIKVSELMNKIKNLYHVIGCSYVMLDHISMVVSGLDQGKDERRELDFLLTSLASFTTQNDIGIFAVSHLNNQAVQEIGKISDMKEKRWVCTRMEHMRGSGILMQVAWVVIGIDKELLPSRERGNVRITVLKNRTMSSTGETDVFHMDQDTGLITLVSEEVEQFGY